MDQSDNMHVSSLSNPPHLHRPNFYHHKTQYLESNQIFYLLFLKEIFLIFPHNFLKITYKHLSFQLDEIVISKLSHWLHIYLIKCQQRRAHVFFLSGFLEIMLQYIDMQCTIILQKISKVSFRPQTKIKRKNI